VVGLSAADIGAWFELSLSIFFGFKGRFFPRPGSLLLGPMCHLGRWVSQLRCDSGRGARRRVWSPTA